MHSGHCPILLVYHDGQLEKKHTIKTVDRRQKIVYWKNFDLRPSPMTSSGKGLTRLDGRGTTSILHS